MSDWAVEHILTQAAHEPSMGDDGFILLSRVMHGLDPFTGESAQGLDPEWWIGTDGYGDMTLWLATSSVDPHPQQVISRHELDRYHPVLWGALIAGLGISDDRNFDKQKSGDDQ